MAVLPTKNLKGKKSGLGSESAPRSLFYGDSANRPVNN